MAHEGLMGRAALPLAKQHAGNRWPRGCFLHGLGCFPEKAEPCGNGVAGHILWLDQGNHEVLRFNELFAGTLGFWDVCKHMQWRSSSSSWFFLVQSWVWNAGCVALIKWMRFPKIFGYSMTFSTYIEKKHSVYLVAVPRIKKVLGLGADRGVDRYGPGVLVFCSQRMDGRWVSWLQRQGWENVQGT